MMICIKRAHTKKAPNKRKTFFPDCIEKPGKNEKIIKRNKATTVYTTTQLLFKFKNVAAVKYKTCTKFDDEGRN